MNMLETLGTLVAIGAFVFWCDVTDSWKNVFLRNKLASRFFRSIRSRSSFSLHALMGLKKGSLAELRVTGFEQTSSPYANPYRHPKAGLFQIAHKGEN
jgi:hypothetical protein